MEGLDQLERDLCHILNADTAQRNSVENLIVLALQFLVFGDNSPLHPYRLMYLIL